MDQAYESSCAFGDDDSSQTPSDDVSEFLEALREALGERDDEPLPDSAPVSFVPDNKAQKEESILLTVQETLATRVSTKKRHGKVIATPMGLLLGVPLIVAAAVGFFIAASFHFPIREKTTQAPSAMPSFYPTMHPTQFPTVNPSAVPTVVPSAAPSVSPTSAIPSDGPTVGTADGWPVGKCVGCIVG